MPVIVPRRADRCAGEQQHLRAGDLVDDLQIGVVGLGREDEGRGGAGDRAVDGRDRRPGARLGEDVPAAQDLDAHDLAGQQRLQRGAGGGARCRCRSPRRGRSSSARGAPPVRHRRRWRPRGRRVRRPCRACWRRRLRRRRARTVVVDGPVALTGEPAGARSRRGPRWRSCVWPSPTRSRRAGRGRCRREQPQTELRAGGGPAAGRRLTLWDRRAGVCGGRCLQAPTGWPVRVSPRAASGTARAPGSRSCDALLLGR